jgi:hypothetical protein
MATRPENKLDRFHTDSLRGEWHRRILRDRSQAQAEWARNLRLQAMPTVEPDEFGAFNLTDHRTMADALEARYRGLRHERSYIVGVMQAEPDNDGRGQVVNPAAGVNATEVRFSERWIMPPDDSLDYTCYRVLPDGTREPFKPDKPDKPDKPRRLETRTDAASDYWSRVVLVGTDPDSFTDN